MEAPRGLSSKWLPPVRKLQDQLHTGDYANSQWPELLRHKDFISTVYWLALGDAMSRFYLHIRCKDGGMSYDDLGLDYPDVETAWRAVAQAAQDLKHVFATRGHDPRDYAIEVANDT